MYNPKKLTFLCKCHHTGLGDNNYIVMMERLILSGTHHLPCWRQCLHLKSDGFFPKISIPVQHDAVFLSFCSCGIMTSWIHDSVLSSFTQGNTNPVPSICHWKIISCLSTHKTHAWRPQREENSSPLMVLDDIAPCWQDQCKSYWKQINQNSYTDSFNLRWSLILLLVANQGSKANFVGTVKVHVSINALP